MSKDEQLMKDLDEFQRRAGAVPSLHRTLNNLRRCRKPAPIGGR